MVVLFIRSLTSVTASFPLKTAAEFFTPIYRKLTIASTANIIAANMTHPRSVSPQQPCSDNVSPQFNPKKVLVLTKITRYEFEKQTHPGLSDEELKKALDDKGSNLTKLKELHDFHKEQADKLVKCLTDKSIQTQVVNRYEYSPEVVSWADAVITAGGDGTFLLGASKLKDFKKPMIGINTDPRRSEGYLCLPKAASTNFAESLDKLLKGQFKWSYRQRIRIQLTGPFALDPPVELHEQQLKFPEQRFTDLSQTEDHETQIELQPSDHSDGRKGYSRPDCEPESFTRVLPEIALNEVFIGESLSSRVSYYEIAVDDAPSVKQKSSGVTICTGTGSTSWSFNINKLTEQATSSIIRIIRDTCKLSVPTDEGYVSLVTKQFNDELVFDPSDKRMVFTIRDPVSNTIYSAANPRGFAKRVTIKSRCYDASLVIDGGPSYTFNDGAFVTLSIHPEDALRTVELL